MTNPFVSGQQEQAESWRLYYYREGAQLAKRVYRAMRARPEGRESYVIAARTRVRELLEQTLPAHRRPAEAAIAEGFLQQLHAYGVYQA